MPKPRCKQFAEQLLSRPACLWSLSETLRVRSSPRGCIARAQLQKLLSRPVRLWSLSETLLVLCSPWGCTSSTQPQGLLPRPACLCLCPLPVARPLQRESVQKRAEQQKSPS